MADLPGHGIDRTEASGTADRCPKADRLRNDQDRPARPALRGSCSVCGSSRPRFNSRDSAWPGWPGRVCRVAAFSSATCRSYRRAARRSEPSWAQPERRAAPARPKTPASRCRRVTSDMRTPCGRAAIPVPRASDRRRRRRGAPRGRAVPSAGPRDRRPARPQNLQPLRYSSSSISPRAKRSARISSRARGAAPGALACASEPDQRHNGRDQQRPEERDADSQQRIAHPPTLADHDRRRSAPRLDSPAVAVPPAPSIPE
jgi:hypothetical protein